MPQAFSRDMFSELRSQMLETGLSTISENAIICPLCWQETDSDELTVEHIVPGSIGGSQTTLTCKKCNNSHGSKLDRQLSELQKFENSLSGDGVLRGTLHTGNERLAVDIHQLAGDTNFVVVPKASNPKHVASSIAKAKAGNIESMKVRFPIFDPTKLNAAFLRIGYLAAFKTAGYSLIKTELLQQCRIHIADCGIPNILVDALVLRFTSFDPNWDFDFCISGCNAAGLDAAIVVIRSQLKGSNNRSFWGVFLPDSFGNFFSEIKTAALAINNGGEFIFH